MRFTKAVGIVVVFVLVTSSLIYAQSSVDKDALTQRILKKIEVKLDFEIKRITEEVEGVLDDCVLGKWKLGDNPREVKSVTPDKDKEALKENILKNVKEKLSEKKKEILKNVTGILGEELNGKKSIEDEGGKKEYWIEPKERLTLNDNTPPAIKLMNSFLNNKHGKTLLGEMAGKYIERGKDGKIELSKKGKELVIEIGKNISDFLKEATEEDYKVLEGLRSGLDEILKNKKVAKVEPPKAEPPKVEPPAKVEPPPKAEHPPKEEVKTGAPWLGLKVDKADQEGIHVSDVTKDSPAEKSGIKKGDLIVEIQGKKVEGEKSLIEMISKATPGQKVSFTIQRGDEKKEINVELGIKPSKQSATPRPDEETPTRVEKETPPKIEQEKPPKVEKGTPKQEKETPPKSEPAKKGSEFPYLGVRILKDDDKGIPIEEVVKDSPAERSGLRKGDIITKINGKKVDGEGSLYEFMVHKAKIGDEVTLTVLKGNKEEEIKVTLGEKKR